MSINFPEICGWIILLFPTFQYIVCKWHRNNNLCRIGYIFRNVKLVLWLFLGILFNNDMDIAGNVLFQKNTVYLIAMNSTRMLEIPQFKDSSTVYVLLRKYFYFVNRISAHSALILC